MTARDCEFASLPSLCSGEHAFIRFESALEKKDSEDGDQAHRDVTSSVPPLSSQPLASSPLLLFEWKDYL